MLDDFNTDVRIKAKDEVTEDFIINVSVNSDSDSNNCDKKW